MIALLLGYTAFLTFVIVYGIHNYEAKIKDYKASIEDYKRALNIARNHSNAAHYTQLQLENASMRKSLYELDLDNHTLKLQLAQSRQELLESRPIQYESSIWQNSVYANQQELELETFNQKPFVRKYGPQL